MRNFVLIALASLTLGCGKVESNVIRDSAKDSVRVVGDTVPSTDSARERSRVIDTTAEATTKTVAPYATLIVDNSSADEITVYSMNGFRIGRAESFRVSTFNISDGAVINDRFGVSLRPFSSTNQYRISEIMVRRGDSIKLQISPLVQSSSLSR